MNSYITKFDVAHPGVYPIFTERARMSLHLGPRRRVKVLFRSTIDDAHLCLVGTYIGELIKRRLK